MTDEIDIADAPVAGGFFVKRSDGEAHRPLVMPTSGGNEGFVYTYTDSPETIKEAVLRLIGQARKRIFIASFRIGNHELMDALHDAANRLHGGVYIISALDERSLARGLAEIEDDTGVDKQVQNKQFDEMTRNGIYVRGHEHCHAKFLVVDGEKAVVSSANLENRAFNVTGECGVVLNDHKRAAHLERFFTRLWFSGCEWELEPGTGYTVRQRQTTASPCHVPMPSDDGGNGIIWTHDNEHFILDNIRAIINKAQKSLLLSTFSTVGIFSAPGLLLAPLQAAINRRGVKVTLLMRARNNKAKARTEAALMAENRIRIVPDTLNHAKGVIADRRCGALFSANLDADHGLTNGVEMGVRIDGTPALQDACRYFDHAISQADAEFKVNPSHDQLNRLIVGGNWRSRWPLPRDVHVDVMRPLWESWLDETVTAPVLYQKAPEGTMRLITGRRVWRMDRNPSGYTYEITPDASPPLTLTAPSATLLERWMTQMPRRDQPDVQKGFCAGRFRVKR